MKEKRLYYILALLAVAGCSKKDKDYLATEQLYEQFQNTGLQYHPFVRWWWNGDKVDADELVRELHLLKEAGIGGVEHAYLVLEGKLLKAGTPEELAADPVVRSHYLGSNFELRKKEYSQFMPSTALKQ